MIIIVLCGAFVAALYPANRHPERVNSYPHFRDVLNVKDISFPMTFSDIAIFERNNPFLNIFVYGLKNKQISGPLYRHDSCKDKSKSIHLLFLKNDRLFHYCLIKDLPHLVKTQITKRHSKLYFCESCLLFFPTPKQFEDHLCEGTVTILPERGSIL